MKYIIVALTLIFSMSGSVNAGNLNTKWVLILSSVSIYSPDRILTSAWQPTGNGIQKGTLTFTECYEEMHKYALRENKKGGMLKDGKILFKIEIVDGVITGVKGIQEHFTAKASYGKIRYELHCVEITLD